MTKSDLELRKIVNLKRRAAESRFRSVSQKIRKLDEEIQNKEDALRTNRDEMNATFSGDLLAAERFTQKLVQDLKALAVQRVPLAKELEIAQYELQKIIVSEDVLESRSAARQR